MVGVCHAIAVVISLCAWLDICGEDRRMSFVFFPHYLFWIFSQFLTWLWPFACLILLATVFVPIWLYRYVNAYGHAGPQLAIASAASEFWKQPTRGERARVAWDYAHTSTAKLVRRVTVAGAELPPVRFGVPPARAWAVVLVSLSISLHHMAIVRSLETLSPFGLPFRFGLATWLSQCTFEWK
jgi:hypothetical protein